MQWDNDDVSNFAEMILYSFLQNGGGSVPKIMTEDRNHVSSTMNHHEPQQLLLQQNNNSTNKFQKLKSSTFELNTKYNSHLRNKGLIQPNESLNEKIAKKDKLIDEQMKLIQELLSHVETLSKMSSFDINRNSALLGLDDDDDDGGGEENDNDVIKRSIDRGNRKDKIYMNDNNIFYKKF